MKKKCETVKSGEKFGMPIILGLVLIRIFITGVFLLSAVACVNKEQNKQAPRSLSGVKKARVTVKTNERGLTVEQENIGQRLNEENEVGNMRHLYIISAYSGDVILYSPVKGKVTSSGKRLSPYTVAAGRAGRGNNSPEPYGIPVSIGGKVHRTPEVLQDDGTYGHSIPYLYWWDTKGVYHKHYVSGGQIPHVTSQPMIVPKVILNVENSGAIDVKNDNKIKKAEKLEKKVDKAIGSPHTL